MENEDNLTVLFLLSVTRKYLPSTSVKLRSYYNSLLLKTANISQIKLPKNVTNRNAVCPYCYFPWSHNTASIKLFPSKKLKNNKVNIENISTNDKDGIKKQRNKLVIKCKVCNQKSQFSLIKKIKKPLGNNEIGKEIVLKPGKKKRKKDKTCGLKKSAINQVKQQTAVQANRRNDSNKQNFSTRNRDNESSSNQISLLNSVNTNRQKSGKNNSSKSKKDIKKSLAIQSQKLVLNPYATQIQNNISRKKQQKQFQKLKQAISSDHEVVKNTLKGFLSLVN